MLRGAVLTGALTALGSSATGKAQQNYIIKSSYIFVFRMYRPRPERSSKNYSGEKYKKKIKLFHQNLKLGYKNVSKWEQFQVVLRLQFIETIGS